ncbi:penicillin-binding transpeptidase domain-containing protein [Variovorax sp.]|uniref:penicillin-binding transpeptidase domain-containing protein n=1 Tax=Variovorax sp. TaxID=1871043 RepID=UPI002D72ADF3|nr:penicillin-binding transpeptidase domain-containing protein [Variovorax sp.]HYP85295.1 penicillin-binding transpeptidase domain-containing protein [Variovorax sp.]
MKRRHFVLAATAASSPPAILRAQGNTGAVSERTVRIRPEWAQLFEAAEVPGTLVVVDARGSASTTFIHDASRAELRLSPASTYKIAHSLIALDAGLVRDEFQSFKWDGVQRSIPAWNQDQTLRSAVRDSAVWVFEGFARQLGTAREEAYMRKIGYGNCLATGKNPFWVDGDLAVSAQEQITMLRALYRNELPFAVAHQRLVKDVLVNEAGSHWILRAKSGWSGSIGWWVGWMEFPEGAVFFALNIDTPRRTGDLPKRMDVVRGALRSIGAWPAGATT